MKNKLIIYELNELPRKLLNYYIKIKPFSNLAYLHKNGHDLNTTTTDKGELHPWSTWATFYRGVDNSKHKIYSLKQDREYDQKYPLGSIHNVPNRYLYKKHRFQSAVLYHWEAVDVPKKSFSD